MSRKCTETAAVLAATMLSAVFTTMAPFSMKDAEGQILPSCPVGYERNVLGTCVPIVNPDPNGGDSDRTETDTEQKIGQKNVCSGWAVCTNDAENREDSAIEIPMDSKN
jgi:hypothetical protein